MKVGFLPLYIALYDKVVPEQRAKHEAYYEELSKKMESFGVEVVRSEVCCVKPEFEKAVSEFEAQKVDAIVTLHLAYSPSGEYYETLCNTKLPIIVLDTTVTEDLSDKQDPDAVSYCHGIHGVMDMCCMFRRNNKPFAICAGHSDNDELFEKLVGYIKAAKSANGFFGASVGAIGTKFEGMEDFSVPDSVLASRFGVSVVRSTKEEIAKIASQITEEEIAKQIDAELKLGKKTSDFKKETHAVSAKGNLIVDKWIKEKGLDAITVNFLDVSEAGFDTMPFMAAGMQMQNGIGYAGEGDVFTALLVGALLKSYKETSFVEIFCPDWKNNTLHISHMGEMNYAVADGELEISESPFIYGNGTPTIIGTASFKPGDAVFVNLFPTKDDFGMVIAPVSVVKETTDLYANRIRGWIKPSIPISSFLEKTSLAGVTHHSALVYGATTEELKFFAECLGVNAIVID